MKTINISHNGKNYKVNISYLPAWPEGYYKADLIDKELLDDFRSPIYISKNEGKLSLPPFKNLAEATFLMSLVTGILTQPEL